MARKRKASAKTRQPASKAKERKSTGHPARPEGRRVKYRAKSKPPTSRPVAQERTAALKGWETRRAKAKARSQAAAKGWATRRRKKRILTNNALRLQVWYDKRKLDVDDFVDDIVAEFDVSDHEAYSLFYSPGLK